MTGYSYNQKLVTFSKLNRKTQTEAERHLWHHLRESVQEHKFRRQFPIDNFILDFYCPKKKLAIELDGSQHYKRKTYDAYRSRKLAERGIRVLRFWNNEVLNSLQEVVERIVVELRKDDTTSS